MKKRKGLKWKIQWDQLDNVRREIYRDDYFRKNIFR